MRHLVFLILFTIEIKAVFAQNYKYVIYFKDKQNNGYTLSNPSAFLSNKSLARRQKQNLVVDSTDLPITDSYVDSIAIIPSVRVLGRSKWFNSIMVSTPDSTLPQKIKVFSFVLKSNPVNNNYHLYNPRKVAEGSLHFPDVSDLTIATSKATKVSSDYFDYGYSARQINIHHGEFLHNLGFHGEGMTIAILDAGFYSYLTNPAFDILRKESKILGTYDYVNQKVSVNEEDGHGANCFSIIASNIPGTMVGTAPEAKYWLFKTEDVNSETPVEEQNWIEAAEFSDSVGVDLITTSLGYDYFDDSLYNLNYAERNGHGSPITIAANLAVAKGIIVTASAGNDGQQTGERKYVICPADGDSVFAIGAIDSSGQIAAFSSWGTNSSNQIKPDGVSVGKGTVFVAPDGVAITGNGTSYSNPNLAGLITCLWQAFPEFNVQVILESVRYSSDHFSNPDNRYGFGIPNFEKAYQVLLVKRNPALSIPDNTFDLKAYPIPFNNLIHLIFKTTVTGTATLQLINSNGEILQTNKIPVVTGELQFYDLISTGILPVGTYFIRFQDQAEYKTIKVLKN